MQSKDRSNIEAGQDIGERTSWEVMQILEESDKPVEIAGSKIDKPAELFHELKRTIDGVKESLGVELDENNIFFKKLEGNTVGKSSGRGIEIDSCMLLHPTCRLAHVIAHESLHGRTPNEGMIEAYLTSKKYKQEGGLVLTDKYIKAEEFFADFINKIRGDLSFDQAIDKVFKFYYSGKFEDIYKMYYKNYLSDPKAPKSKDKDDLFKQVFPELILNSVGQNVVEPYFPGEN